MPTLLRSSVAVGGGNRPWAVPRLSECTGRRATVASGKGGGGNRPWAVPRLPELGAGRHGGVRVISVPLAAGVGPQRYD